MPSKPAAGGLFGGKKRLEVENAELRAALERAGAMPAYALDEERQRLETRVTDLRRQADELTEQLKRLQDGIVALLTDPWVMSGLEVGVGDRRG